MTNDFPNFALHFNITWLTTTEENTKWTQTQDKVLIKVFLFQATVRAWLYSHDTGNTDTECVGIGCCYRTTQCLFSKVNVQSSLKTMNGIDVTYSSEVLQILKR